MTSRPELLAALRRALIVLPPDWRWAEIVDAFPLDARSTADLHRLAAIAALPPDPAPAPKYRALGSDQRRAGACAPPARPRV